LSNPFGSEDQHAGRKIGEHGLAEVLTGAGAVLLGQVLHLQCVLLLLQFLDHVVVEVNGSGLRGES
jgi:hypothetical protein